MHSLSSLAATAGTRRAGELFEICRKHPALSALDTFNRHLASRALDRPELVLLLASLAAFNRHTVAGIAILAGRISDQVLPLAPKQGHEIGACVLDAAVDEYGLRESRTHVELARDFAAHLGISLGEVENRHNACVAAVELGDALYGWYRDRRVAFGLGAHAASEVTSAREFPAWQGIFLSFPEYGLSASTPAFEYLRAHCVHEPDHEDAAKLCVARYLDLLPEHAPRIEEGVRAYLSAYRRMFDQLDTRIFRYPQAA